LFYLRTVQGEKESVHSELLTPRKRPAPHGQTRQHEEANMTESIICADAPVVTLINVFTVDPANQQRLVS
jgi:hypothetical protein